MTETATLHATGPTLPDLFESAAFAVFDLSFDLSGVAPTYSRPVVAPGDTTAELLRNWLVALLAESRRSEIAFSLFMVDRLEEGGVQGSASGMPKGSAVRRPHMVGGVTNVEAPVEVGDGWSVRFEVAIEPRLRAIGNESDGVRS